MLRENISKTMGNPALREFSPVRLVTRAGGRLLKSDAANAAKPGSSVVSDDSGPEMGPTVGLAAELTGQPQTQSLTPGQWTILEDGLRQRYRAINTFLSEVLTRGNIPEFMRREPVAASVMARVPRGLIGVSPSGGNWVRLASSDIYVTAEGEFVVLDHNFACPVGLLRVSELTSSLDQSEHVDRWVSQQLRPAGGRSGSGRGQSCIAVLDAGAFSAAFRENEYLASRTGGRLVRSRDLMLDDEGLAIVQHGQRERVDLLVRRVDDDLLDPNCFRPDSLVGIPGLVRACREGRVNVLNAPGTGLMNNRAVSRLIPEMIRHYLSEVPILRSVATLLCGQSEQRDVVLSDLTHYSVRTIDPLHPSRPWFGRTATAVETSDMMTRLLRDPAGFVARPLLASEPARRSSDRSGQDVPVAASVVGGFNLRVFAGFAARFELLNAALGRPAQSDGGATLAISSDPTAFLVR